MGTTHLRLFTSKTPELCNHGLLEASSYAPIPCHFTHEETEAQRREGNSRHCQSLGWTLGLRALSRHPSAPASNSIFTVVEDEDISVSGFRACFWLWLLPRSPGVCVWGGGLQVYGRLLGPLGPFLSTGACPFLFSPGDLQPPPPEPDSADLRAEVLAGNDRQVDGQKR